MNKIIQSAEPYTSIKVSSLRSGDELLEGILSSDRELFPRKIDRPVVLYGAGSLGKMAKNFFDYLHMPYLYVVDKNAAQYKKDKYWQGVNIIHPSEVKETDKTNCLLVICIVTIPLIALRDQLRDDGWGDVAFFYDVSEFYSNRYPINNGWFLNKINENEKKAIGKVYSSFADDTSRLYYLQFLAWRKLRIELLFESLEVNNDNRFFIPEVVSVLHGDEVFVDCGAHWGFVMEKFVKVVEHRYKALYAIEPDSNNVKMLEERLKNISSIKILKCALGDVNGEGKFYQGFDYASKLSENGGDLVKITTLDRMNIPATFIKLHLEGGDLKALKGAVNTIREYRPIIAVTIYHNADGVWETPYFLMSNTRNYKYYLRLHSWGGTGAVLYAIPKERKNAYE
ncbi:MAG: FkbM family methyltransferase [Candidatus Paceibacterota bacterium]|jgi:FkbM family methyltransferase